MGAKGDTNGTTKLHLDVTCAINVMMWSQDMTSRRPGAEWQIFPADSISSLRSFLREEFSLSGDDDPIHQQCYYISHAMLARLRERYGVAPWTIYQYYGDVVFIPAGCPHQVSFLLVDSDSNQIKHVYGGSKFGTLNQSGVRLRLPPALKQNC